MVHLRVSPLACCAVRTKQELICISIIVLSWRSPRRSSQSLPRRVHPLTELSETASSPRQPRRTIRLPSMSWRLPTFSFVKNSSSEDRPANWGFAGGFEFDKEIFPRFALGVSDTYHYFNPDHGRTAQGWDNLTFGAKYELWRSEPMEAIASVGLHADVGGTGSRGIGRDSFTTFTPAFFFGKGFGDLPERVGFLRPFAVTGEIRQSFSTSPPASNTLEWGFALEYSLPYLQQQVKDVGLPAPLQEHDPAGRICL